MKYSPSRFRCICFLATSSLFFGTLASADEVADTVSQDERVTTLEEIVVKGERAWIEGDKAVFIPTKSEKNLATDPATLVKNMHIPTIVVEGSSMKSRTGQEVQVFINGRRAESVDLQTFWPKQAIRVEYLENPSDPAYEGAKVVVNFVMHEYEVGGVTKVSGYQELPNSGNYNAASKIVYKDMTYGVVLKGGYERDHISWSEGEDLYKDIFYDGIHYDEVNRHYSTHPWSRSDNAGVAFSAKYLKPGKITATHNLSFNWKRDPGSGSKSSEDWTPDLLDSKYSFSDASGRSISPSISGRYNIQICKNGLLVPSWSYSYSRNHNYSYYRSGELEPILNSNAEDVHDGKLGLYFGKKFSEKFSLGANVTSEMDWYSTRYRGSANELSRQWRGATTCSVGLYYSPSSIFSVYMTPGVNINYWHVSGADRYNRAEPSGQLQMRWAPNRKTSLSLYGFFNSYAPSAAKSSDVLIRQDNLNWIAGNPSMKNNNWWSGNLILNWMPYGWLRLSPLLGYSRDSNNSIFVFTPASPEMGGLIRTYTNAGADENYKVQLDCSASFLNDKLDVHFGPNWDYYKTSGTYRAHQSWLRVRGSLSYTFGNFRTSFVYSGKQKYISNGGMERGESYNGYSFSLTYGNGNIYVDLDYSETFRSHPRRISVFDSPYFSNFIHEYGLPRSLSLRLTYTFGYGKKINRSIDVQGPSEAKTGVLK